MDATRLIAASGAGQGHRTCAHIGSERPAKQGRDLVCALVRGEGLALGEEPGARREGRGADPGRAARGAVGLLTAGPSPPGPARPREMPPTQVHVPCFRKI